MTVKMLTHIAGTPSYYGGQIVDLEPRIAEAWIKEGICVPLRAAGTARAADVPKRADQ